MVSDIGPLNTESCDQLVWYVFGFWTVAAVVEAADVEWQRVNGAGVYRMSDAALRSCAVLVDVLVASVITTIVFVVTLYLTQLIQVL